MSAVRFLVPVAAAAVLAVAGHAQPPAKRADDKKVAADKKPAGGLATGISASDEHKLFAQLLEYLHRDTFPPNAKSDPDVQPKGSGQVKMFVEQRRKMIGYVRTRLRDMRASPELFDMYDDYLEVLAEADKYGDRLRAHEEDYYKRRNRIVESAQYRAAIAYVNRAANLIQHNAWVAAHSVGGWWGRWRGWYSPAAGTTLMVGNAIAADLRYTGDLLHIMNQTKDRLLAFERRELPIMTGKLRDEEDRFVRDLANKREKVLDKGAKSIDKLTSQYSWKPLEVTLRPFDDDALKTNGNGFVPLSDLNRINEVTSTRQADDCEKAAERLLDMVEKLPPGSPKDSTQVYSRIRADIAFLAGMHANRAADYQLGGDGFAACVKTPPSAAKVATRAFKMYDDAAVAMDPRPHPKAEEYHQKALAYAYSGLTKKAAYVVNDIMSKDLGGVNDPKFYFDCARLCCMGDNDMQKKGLRFLAAAFMYGWTNSEKARVAPEMETLRKINPGLFDKAVALNKDKSQ